jgi:hypothetical protein
MNNYKAYTYLLKFKLSGKVYYGVRFKNIRLKRHPHEDFMIQYTTSSKQINDLINEYGIDSFEYEIRKVFNSPEHAIAWETKVLRRCNVLKRQDIWYNANIAGYKVTTPKGRKSISNRHTGIPKTTEHKAKISAQMRGIKKNYIQSAEQRQKNSEAHKGKNHPMYGVILSPEERLKRGAKNKGKVPYNKGTIKSQEEKDKAKATREKNKKVCEHCGKVNIAGLYTRWHGDNCKFNMKDYADRN